MTEVQEQFSKLAESKLTYSSFHPSNFFPSTPPTRTPPPPTPLSFLLPTLSRLLPTVVNDLVQSPSLGGFGNHPCYSFAHTLAYRNASPPFVASKRTFTSLVSKMKAKVQEFEQTRYAEIFTLFFSSLHDLLLPHGPAPPHASAVHHFRCFRTFVPFAHLRANTSGIPPTPLPLILAPALAQATMLSPLRLC